MIPNDFENLFKRISNTLTLNTVSEGAGILPIWDFLNEYDESVLTITELKKRPLRILFYIYISEIESRLYKIIKREYPEIYNNLAERLSLLDLIKLLKKYIDNHNSNLCENLNKINVFRNKIVHLDPIAEKDWTIKYLKNMKNLLISTNDELQKILGIEKYEENA